VKVTVADLDDAAGLGSAFNVTPPEPDPTSADNDTHVESEATVHTTVDDTDIQIDPPSDEGSHVDCKIDSLGSAVPD